MGNILSYFFPDDVTTEELEEVVQDGFKPREAVEEPVRFLATNVCLKTLSEPTNSVSSV